MTVRVSTESWPWRRKVSHHSCQDLNPQPFNHQSGALPLSYPCSRSTYWTGVLCYHWAIPAPVLLTEQVFCATTELSLLQFYLLNRRSALPLSYLCSHSTYWTGVLRYHWAIPAPVLLTEQVFYLARAACCCSMAFLLCWVTKGCGVMLRKPGDNVTVLPRPNISVLAAGRSVAVWPRREEPFLPVEWTDKSITSTCIDLYRWRCWGTK